MQHDCNDVIFFLYCLSIYLKKKKKKNPYYVMMVKSDEKG